MGLRFSVKFDQKAIGDFLHHELKDKIAEGCRQGLNRAVAGVQKDAVDTIPSVFNPKGVPAARIRKDFIAPIKAHGLDIENMEAKARVRSDRGVSLIRFASPMRIQKQKKVPVKGRASANYWIKKGARENTGGTFIQSASGTGGKLIYRAGPSQRKGRLLSQYAKSIAAMLQDEDVAQRFDEKVAERVQKELDQAIGYALSKL